MHQIYILERVSMYLNIYFVYMIHASSDIPRNKLREKKEVENMTTYRHHKKTTNTTTN